MENNLYTLLRRFIIQRFSLHDDSADSSEIIESISKGVEFKGANLWALIFAIFIASIGLNVNSTAVIIGAMLISPIMGPIMGIGLGIGINEIELIKRGAKNLLIAAIISICVSAFYFYISPLREAQSELLARTTPTIWDVFIAFFGGLAGIVGGTRKEKSNVIPGVAIATALMPPLCTAGYGLASGHMLYFLGALYLFFINSVFICIGTYLVVKYIHLPRKSFVDARTRKRATIYILIIVTLTILPSVYLAYGIVAKSIFETNAAAFVRKECEFANTQLVNKRFDYDRKNNKIDLLFIGEELTPATIADMESKLPKYNLRGTQLVIHQGLNAKKEINFADIKASILEDIFSEEKKKQQQKQKDSAVNKLRRIYPDIRAEVAVLYPEVEEYTLSNTVFHQTDTAVKDTIALFTATIHKRLSSHDEQRMQQWLCARLRTDTVALFINYTKK